MGPGTVGPENRRAGEPGPENWGTGGLRMRLPGVAAAGCSGCRTLRLSGVEAAGCCGCRVLRLPTAIRDEFDGARIGSGNAADRELPLC